jgi:hypothetical protein
MYQIHNGMTAEQFKTVQAKAKGMTLEQLIWSRNDAQKAAEAFKGVMGFGACKGEGWYMDEALTYSDEIRKRQSRV